MPKNTFKYKHIYYLNESFFISNRTYNTTPKSNIHFHNGYEIILVTEGKYRIYAPQNIYEGSGPCIGFFKKGTYHGCVFYDCEEFPANRFVINYTNDLVDRIPAHMLDAKELFKNDVTVIPLSSESFNILLFFFNEMYKCYEKSGRYTMLSPQIHTYMAALLNMITDMIKQHPATIINVCGTSDNYVYDIIREIIDMPDDAHDISSVTMAERYNVSQSKLQADFKQITGVSIKQMMDAVKIERIKRMLWVGTSNKAIVEQFGFSSESYFIQFFKNHVKVSPGEFRKYNDMESK